MSRGFTDDVLLEIAKGNVPGHYAVNKFGSSSFIKQTPTDVWDIDSTPWLAPTAARVHTIASTSAKDTDGGEGARTVRVYGLTDWGSAETFEDVTLNTGTPPTTAAYVIIHRMIVLTCGTQTGPVTYFPNVGTISATAATDGTVTALIAPIKGQTQMAIFGVPSTQKFYMYNYAASIAHTSAAPAVSDSAGVIVLQSTDIVNNPKTFTFKHTGTIQDDGLTTIDSPFPVPKLFEGPCIIKIAMVASITDAFCDASFDGVLVDNDIA
jgi:hypothetical protein